MKTLFFSLAQTMKRVNNAINISAFEAFTHVYISYMRQIL